MDAKEITQDQAWALFDIVDKLFGQNEVTPEDEVIDLLNKIDGGERSTTGYCDPKGAWL